MRLSIIYVFTILLPLFSNAQTVVHGKVIDASTKESLPYANIILKRQGLGTTSNDLGEFRFKMDDTNDSIAVYYLGYEPYIVPANGMKSPATIAMVPSGVELDEVVIRPKPPTYYIKQAVIHKDENFASNAFNTRGYYRQAVFENKQALHFEEAYIKTYHHTKNDTTIQDQHQVILYAEPDVLGDLEFMKDKIAKQNAKAKRKAEKKGEEYEEESTKEMIASSFSGPESVIRGDWVNDDDSYLDSNYFKKYDYRFGKPTTYAGRKVMVIHFETKRKVDHTRQKGTLYLDDASLAMVKLDVEGEVVIPAYVKPLLFAIGLGIKNPTYAYRSNYSYRNESWYPQFVSLQLDLTLIERHLFSKNEESDFYIDLLYAVNELETSDVKEIEEEKRYDSKKPMKEQIHPEPGIQWSKVNKIR